MLQDIKNTVQIGKKLAQKLDSYQIRATYKSAIVIMNGYHDIINVYGEDIDATENKELFQNIIDAANTVFRVIQGAVIANMKQVDFENEEQVRQVRKKATQTDFGSTKANVTVTMNVATQEFTSVAIANMPDLDVFAQDLVMALNSALLKSRVEMGKAIKEIMQ